MNRNCYALLIVLALTASHPKLVAASPEIPGSPQRRPIALVGGTIHTAAGEPIAEGTLLFDGGRIVAVGKTVEIPANAEQIDVRGKHVFPGIINAHGSLGLVEIDSVRATIDMAETGRINPNVRAQVAVNPDSELIPVARSGGVLVSLTAPSGGLVSGTSAVIQHDGWTWEDMTLRAPIGMHVSWPAVSSTIEASNQQLKGLRQAFDDARAYGRARGADSSGPVDARWEAMQPVLNGKLPLIVEANRIEQIQSAVAFAERQQVRLIILGGYDAGECVRLLKKHKVPVIVGGVLRVPMRRSDDYDAPFTLPERLRKAGVSFCIAMGGRFSDSNMRNLPYHAATAAAYGLPRDEALKSVTLWAAKILGIDDRVGSLETGKDATLLVADGDLLEGSTRVLSAYIQGRKVDLSDRHKRLWKKYQEKYRRLDGDEN